MVDLRGEGPEKDRSGSKRFGDRLQEQWQNFRRHDRVEDVVNYTKNNKRDTIAYALLVVGIVLLFLEPAYGGLLIGIVASIYFARDLGLWITFLKSNRQGTAKMIVLTGTLFAIFFQAPAIFIGFAIGALLQKLLMVDAS